MSKTYDCLEKMHRGVFHKNGKPRKVIDTEKVSTNLLAACDASQDILLMPIRMNFWDRLPGMLNHLLRQTFVSSLYSANKDTVAGQVWWYVNVGNLWYAVYDMSKYFRASRQLVHNIKDSSFYPLVEWVPVMECLEIMHDKLSLGLILILPLDLLSIVDSQDFWPSAAALSCVAVGWVAVSLGMKPSTGGTSTSPDGAPARAPEPAASADPPAGAPARAPAGAPAAGPPSAPSKVSDDGPPAAASADPVSMPSLVSDNAPPASAPPAAGEGSGAAGEYAPSAPPRVPYTPPPTFTDDHPEGLYPSVPAPEGTVIPLMPPPDEFAEAEPGAEPGALQTHLQSAFDTLKSVAFENREFIADVVQAAAFYTMSSNDTTLLTSLMQEPFVDDIVQEQRKKIFVPVGSLKTNTKTNMILMGLWAVLWVGVVAGVTGGSLFTPLFVAMLSLFSYWQVGLVSLLLPITTFVYQQWNNLQYLRRITLLWKVMGYAGVMFCVSLTTYNVSWSYSPYQSIHHYFVAGVVVSFVFRAYLAAGKLHLEYSFDTVLGIAAAVVVAAAFATYEVEVLAKVVAATGACIIFMDFISPLIQKQLLPFIMDITDYMASFALLGMAGSLLHSVFSSCKNFVFSFF